MPCHPLAAQPDVMQPMKLISPRGRSGRRLHLFHSAAAPTEQRKATSPRIHQPDPVDPRLSAVEQHRLSTG